MTKTKLEVRDRKIQITSPKPRVDTVFDVYVGHKIVMSGLGLQVADNMLNALAVAFAAGKEEGAVELGNSIYGILPFGIDRD